MIDSGVLLLVYCIGVTVASLAGGWLPTRWQFGHTQMQFMMSFVAGLMLGVAVLHLLPHAALAVALDEACTWMLIGLLGMFFTIRLFHVHQHSVADPSMQDGRGGDSTCREHSHAGPTHAHGHHHHHETGGRASRFSWLGLAFGLALHSFFDGVAVGAQLAADLQLHADAALPGIGVFLVVFFHKPLDALAITTLMTVAGSSLRTTLAVNAAFAAVCPVGAVLFFFGAAANPGVVGAALGLAAGVFICIALADILPEVSFHSHDRTKLSVALILGVLLAIAIGWLEGAGHGHGPDAGHDHHQHEHSHSHSH